MQKKTKQGPQTVRRAYVFLSGPDFLRALGGVTAHAGSLGEALQQLEQLATEQDTHDRSACSATQVKQALSRALRQEYLRPIALAARFPFANDPGVRAGFRLAKDLDDEGLLQAAHAFASGAEAHREKFVAKGLAPDFVERLQRAADDFRESMVSRAAAIGRRAAATAGLLEEARQARQLVRLIDVMLAPRLATQPELLAEWKSHARFVRQRTAGVADEAIVDGVEGSAEGVIALQAARPGERAA